MARRAHSIAAAAVALAACVAVPPPALSPPAPPAIVPAACPDFESSDWAAWVNAAPGPAAGPRLIVIGKIATPTGGYRWEWGDLRVLESYPVQIVAELRVTPPAGMATQAVMTHTVRGEWPAGQPIGSVSVQCGNRLLARIAPVETVH